MKLHTKHTLALATLALCGTAALAQSAPETSLSFNVGAVSEYRYRGLSQSGLEPALQAGVDYAHSSGLYVGAWASSIKWIKETAPGLKGDTEIDIYGGYKTEIAKDLTADVGLLRYQYPNNNYKLSTGANANTTEVYGALTYGPVTAKYSYALTDLFGYADSKGSTYLDLSATFDLGNGFSLVPHAGYQKVKNVPNVDVVDYSLTLAKDLGNGLSVSAAWVGTDVDFTSPKTGDKLSGDKLVVGVKYSF